MGNNAFVSDKFCIFFDGVLEMEGTVEEAINHYEQMFRDGYDARSIEIFEQVPTWDYQMYCDDGEFLTIDDLIEIT